jgi:hypothetical protein
LLALASVAVVLADARPAALLAPASLTVVLADARPAALLDPRVRQSILIGMIRPIGVDHTKFFKWLSKLIHAQDRGLLGLFWGLILISVSQNPCL